MDIDYFDEDFCEDDVEEMTKDERDDAKADLQCEIDNSKERIDVYQANLKLFEGKV